MTNKPIYLDNAATSWPKPDEVGLAAARAYSMLFANSGRSGYAASVESARLVFQTRERIARLIGSGDSRNVVFTRGTTEGLNLILRGLLSEGDTVAVSPMEHNSVMRPLQSLIRSRGINVVILPANKEGCVNVAEAARSNIHPRLIVLAHVTNVNGVIQDIQGIRAAFPDSALLLDAAQSAGVLDINVDRDSVDFLCASAHKGLLGPTGLGIAYLSPRFDIEPLIEGGTGSYSKDILQPCARPDRFEAGTLNLHGLLALSGALDYLERHGVSGSHKKKHCLRLIEGISTNHRIHLQSPTDGNALAVSFAIDGITPDAIARSLEEKYGILSRPGLHCAPVAHKYLGSFPSGTVRLSPGYATSDMDIDHAIEALLEISRA